MAIFVVVAAKEERNAEITIGTRNEREVTITMYGRYITSRRVQLQVIGSGNPSVSQILYNKITVNLQYCTRTNMVS